MEPADLLGSISLPDLETGGISHPVSSANTGNCLIISTARQLSHLHCFTNNVVITLRPVMIVMHAHVNVPVLTRQAYGDPVSSPDRQVSNMLSADLPPGVPRPAD